MSFNKPKAPTPPDPYKTADAQWGYTQRTLEQLQRMNVPNTVTPFGSVRTTIGPNGQQTQTVTLDPAQQRLLDSQRGLANNLSNRANSMLGQLPQGQFSLDQVGRPLPGVNDYGEYGNQIAQTSFNEARGLLDPVFQQQNRDLTQSLADRGQPMAGEGAGIETTRMRDAQNRAYTSAANNALLNAGNEMSRINAMENQNFNTALGARLTERSLPQQELQGLLGLSGSQAAPYQQQAAMPQSNASAPDFMGAQQMQYQGLLNNYNQDMQSYNNTWNTIGQVAGMGMKALAGPIGGMFGGGGGPTHLAADPKYFSSRDYKERNAPAGDVLDKVAELSVERWRYKPHLVGEPNPVEHIGPYAEDFKEAFGIGDGKTISSVDAIGVLFRAVQELTAEVRALRAA